MPLSQDEIDARLRDHHGWQLRENALVRQYAFPSYPDAIAFVVRLAFDAEASDHHPDLLIKYRKVTVTWSTHSEGGVTEKDFTGIEQADRTASLLAGRS